MLIKNSLLTLGFSLMFCISSQAQDQAQTTAILHGQGLAELNCSRCHAIGLSGESRNKDAPPFRAFSSYRSITLIGWELMNGDWGEHRKMPQFEVKVDQVRDIVEWIRWVQPIAHGERLVKKNCAGCHAVGADDQSTHTAAIPFRDISLLYPVEALEEAFAEGIVTGHPDMPEFTATAEQTDAIITYMDSIQQQPSE